MKQNINTTLDSVNCPFQKLQADVADLRFTYPGIGPQYALLLVDIFTSHIWTYPMKTKSQLADKIKIFYENVWSNDQKYKYEGSTERNLQTDMEFKQHKIYALNKMYNVNMYSSKTSQGHAFAAEERIKALKTGLTIYLSKAKSNKGLQTKNKYKILHDITQYLNNKTLRKYGYSPIEAMEAFESGPTNHKAQKLFARRNAIVEKSYKRNDRYDKNVYDRRKGKLSDLEVGDVVLIESGRIRKSDATTIFDKATTNKRSPFNRQNLYVITNKYKQKVVANKAYYLYKVAHLQTNEPLTGRFKREELYRLKQ